jgi:nicotinamide mononucleotide adenylyltransferase
MNKEIGIYPGSFRPFHNEHLARVKLALQQFPDMQLIIAVSAECSKKEGANRICGLAAVGMVNEVVESERIKDRVKIRMVDQLFALDFLLKNNISRIMTGSKLTITNLIDLKEKGLWNGEVVELDNSGIHSAEIRNMIASGNMDWKEYIHPVIQPYLERLNFSISSPI